MTKKSGDRAADIRHAGTAINKEAGTWPASLLNIGVDKMFTPKVKKGD
jgi:hypothetical protein